MASGFSRSIASDIIELTVKGQSRLLVHKEVLAAQSQPFRNAITGLWKESSERKINLEDWDIETVGQLVEFLYTGNYSYPDPESVLPRQQTSGASGSRSSQHGSRAPGAMNSRAPGGELPLNRDRPLTPLNQCLPHCLPDEQKTDAERLRCLGPDQYNYRDALLSHAKVYVLARYKAVDSLQILSLKRLVMTLSRINPIHTDSRLPLGIIDLVKYIYSHTDSLTSSEEPLRRLISQFAALNFTALQAKVEFAELMSEGGDFVNDLMMKVSRRLIAAEKGLGVGVVCGSGPFKFVSHIRVLYSLQPHDCIQEMNGGSSNITHLQPSGSSVYLVPEYTTLPEDACTEVQINVQSGRDVSKSDLAINGKTGMFRYLILVKDLKVKEKITEISLLGATSRVKNVTLVGSGEFDGMTTDINTHRNNGYYLCLVWKSVETS